jgi:hypothetical protein
LDEDFYLNVGAYCEHLLADPTFKFLSGNFEAQQVAQFLSTQPHETKLRESIYSRVQAHRDFMATIIEFAQKKVDAEKPADQTDIDDPSVHDIYKGFID